MSRVGLAILGSTGSVGTSTLRVVQENPSRFHVVALAAHSNDRQLLLQCQEHRPEYAVLVEEEAARRLQAALARHGLPTRVLCGLDALEEVARLPQVERVMAAIVGAAGLLPTLAAARAGKTVLLANKESLVLAGNLLMQAVRDGGGKLLPIDSEHNAIFQCLSVVEERPDDVVRLLLTASGGPFLEYPLEGLSEVTPEQACAHPKWAMGPKISVDSATMMNKGLEIIEACWLFQMPAKRIDVLVHPQSIVHSLVEYRDGSVLAQLGCPDMRTPIAHALGWPQRIASGAPSLDLLTAGPLEFRAASETRFPCLALARQAAEASDSLPAVLNAANEEAVAAFLDRRLPFTGIAHVVGDVLEQTESESVTSVEQVLAIDAAARRQAQRAVARRGAAA